MVLIEYAVVNIILGDGSGDAAKGPAKPEPKPSKATDLAIKVRHIWGQGETQVGREGGEVVGGR